MSAYLYWFRDARGEIVRDATAIFYGTPVTVRSLKAARAKRDELSKDLGAVTIERWKPGMADREVIA